MRTLKKFPFRLTIGAKLIGLVALLLLTTASSIVVLSNLVFVHDNTGLIQQTNADVAAGLAWQVHTLFDGLTGKMRVLGAAFLQEYKTEQGRDAVLRESFAADKDFLALFLHEHGTQGHVQLRSFVVSPQMAVHGDKDGTKALSQLSLQPDFSWETIARGGIQITLPKLSDNRRAVALAIPFVKSAMDPSRFSYSLLALIDQERLLQPFAENALVTGYLVDARGRLLAHPDPGLMGMAPLLDAVPIVAEMLKGESSNYQKRYEDPRSGETMLGAFHRVGFGGMGVIAEVPEDKALEAPRTAQYRAMLVAMAVICVAFFLGFLLSDSITWPIKQLALAAHRISQGDFAIRLHPTTRDEVAELSVAFNRMAKGLEVREHQIQNIRKLHDPEVLQKLLSGELTLGGEHRQATILFSDIRGFTTMSEQMKPQEVLEMLNEYMTRMVQIIRTHGGIVDKYVGDAIMAVWGVPIGHAHDTFNAVRACLAMREELARLNELRLSRGQPVLRIGMGLNCGEVIAGNVGSEERMEYTVIGDPVNVAARVESMTKVLGTDLLVDCSVRDLVPDLFIFDVPQNVTVKGKSTQLEVYKVLGYLDEKGESVIVQTPYSSYPPEKSEKVAA